MILPVTGHSRFRTIQRSFIMILLLILSGATATIPPVSALAGISISAQGDQSYYSGENVVFSGENAVSDFTYLVIAGPGIPAGGGRLTSPHQAVLSGDSGSFDRIATNPEGRWHYTFHTSGLGLDAGTYTIYAASRPETGDRMNGIEFSTVSIILKRPFVSAGITPPSVPKGQQFTITGCAEGDPGAVHIWIIGDNFLYDTTVSPGPGAVYVFDAGTDISGNLPDGECYLIVQHPMQNNRFDIVRDGEWVKILRVNERNVMEATNLFRIQGPGSLQGRDAVNALVSVFADSPADDTYAEVVFTVDERGITAPEMQPPVPVSAQIPPEPLPIRYAFPLAVALAAGILLLRRHQAP